MKNGNTSFNKWIQHWTKNLYSGLENFLVLIKDYIQWITTSNNKAILIFGIIILAFTLYVFLYPFSGESPSYRVKAGDIAKQDYYNESNQEIVVVDEILTEERNASVKLKLPPALDYDPQIEEEIYKKINQIADKVKEVKEIEDPNRKIALLRSYLNNIITGDPLLDSSIQMLTTFNNEQLHNFIEALKRFTTYIYQFRGVFEGDTSKFVNKDQSYFSVEVVNGASQEVVDDFISFNMLSIISISDLNQHTLENEFRERNSSLNKEVIRLAADLATSLYTTPNLRENQQRTDIIYQNLTNEPVMGTIKAGEVIITKGKRFNERLAMLVNALLVHQAKKDTNIYGILGTFLFLLTFGVVIVLFIRLYKWDEFFTNESTYILLYFILGINVLLLHVVLNNQINIEGVPSGLLFPMGMSAMLMAILINHRVAIFMVIIITMLYVYLAGVTGQLIYTNDLISPFLLISSGIIGVFATIHIKKRGDLFNGALFISISNVVLCFIALFLTENMNSENITETIMRIVSISLLNGYSSAMLTLGVLPTLENTLNIPTLFRLMELADLNVPVLKEMLIKAPGTYQHCIIVANLSEAASEEIQANSVLAKVGAYYHDIGKLDTPEYFSENQMGKENIHNQLKPTLSAAILKSHVKKGVELGKRLKLPREILNFIPEHHGTSVMQYFYNKARDFEAAGEEPDKSNYTYAGPKPQSKETAIVMLADAIEAASKSLTKPTSKRLEELIDKIIQDKMNEGQLLESNLTFAEINKIKSAFLRVLNGVFHQRIQYPTTEQLEETVTKAKTDETQVRDKLPTRETAEGISVPKGSVNITNE